MKYTVGYAPSLQDELRVRYINTHDKLFHANADAQQVVSRIMAVSPYGSKSQKNIDFGSSYDSYRIQRYISTALLQLDKDARHTVQREAILRRNLLETIKKYLELVQFEPEGLQGKKLETLENILSDSIIESTRSEHKNRIMKGHRAGEELSRKSQAPHHDTLHKDQNGKHSDPVTLDYQNQNGKPK